MSNQQDTTVKINTITAQNELEYYQTKFNEALAAMKADPFNPDTIKAFEDANGLLVACQDKYRIGARIVLEAKINERGGGPKYA